MLCWTNQFQSLEALILSKCCSKHSALRKKKRNRIRRHPRSTEQQQTSRKIWESLTNRAFLPQRMLESWLSLIPSSQVWSTLLTIFNKTTWQSWSNLTKTKKTWKRPNVYRSMLLQRKSSELSGRDSLPKSYTLCELFSDSGFQRIDSSRSPKNSKHGHNQGRWKRKDGLQSYKLLGGNWQPWKYRDSIESFRENERAIHCSKWLIRDWIYSIGNLSPWLSEYRELSNLGCREGQYTGKECL